MHTHCPCRMDVLFVLKKQTASSATAAHSTFLQNKLCVQIPTAAAVVAYALASTCGLLCKMDYMFAEALAADTAHPLNTAFYR